MNNYPHRLKPFPKAGQPILSVNKTMLARRLVAVVHAHTTASPLTARTAQALFARYEEACSQGLRVVDDASRVDPALIVEDLLEALLTANDVKYAVVASRPFTRHYKHDPDIEVVRAVYRSSFSGLPLACVEHTDGAGPSLLFTSERQLRTYIRTRFASVREIKATMKYIIEFDQSLDMYDYLRRPKLIVNPTIRIVSVLRQREYLTTGVTGNVSAVPRYEALKDMYARLIAGPHPAVKAAADKLINGKNGDS